MPVAGRKTHVEKMAQQRRQIQEQIKSLNNRRSVFLADQQRKQREMAAAARPAADAAMAAEAAPAAPSFQEAVIQAVQQQAAEK